MEDYLVVNHLGIAWERLTAFNHQIFWYGTTAKCQTI